MKADGGSMELSGVLGENQKRVLSVSAAQLGFS